MRTMTDLIKETMENFRKNRFEVSFFQTGQEAADYLCQEIRGKTVGFGDSATLAALGLSDRLREHNTVYDPRLYHDEEFYAIARKAMTTDVFLLSANGVSASGEIVNIDGSGNRVAGSIFGHEKVYFVFCADKIETNLEKAIWRARNIAAPQNAKRFGWDTPCAIKGDRCYDCNSPDRICNVMAIHMKKERNMDEEIVIIGETV